MKLTKTKLKQIIREEIQKMFKQNQKRMNPRYFLNEYGEGKSVSPELKGMISQLPQDAKDALTDTLGGAQYGGLKIMSGDIQWMPIVNDLVRITDKLKINMAVPPETAEKLSLWLNSISTDDEAASALRQLGSHLGKGDFVE